MLSFPPTHHAYCFTLFRTTSAWQLKRITLSKCWSSSPSHLGRIFLLTRHTHTDIFFFRLYLHLGVNHCPVQVFTSICRKVDLENILSQSPAQEATSVGFFDSSTCTRCHSWPTNGSTRPGAGVYLTPQHQVFIRVLPCLRHQTRGLG